MSDFHPREEEQIVDLDACPKGKSVLVGAAITALLSIASFGVPSLGLPFVLGAFAAAGHFAVSYRITIRPWQGVKLGVFASALGGAAGLIRPYLQLSSLEQWEWEDQANLLAQQAYESGMPEFADAIKEVYAPESIPLFLGAMLLLALLAALSFGALGGMLAATWLKKGPQAL